MADQSNHLQLVERSFICIMFTVITVLLQYMLYWCAIIVIATVVSTILLLLLILFSFFDIGKYYDFFSPFYECTINIRLYNI